MKNVSTAALVSGFQLVGLGASPADPTVLQPTYAPEPGSTSHQALDPSALRTAEAAHLEVYAGCKWGRAAFDPIRVESESLTAEILALHAQIA